MTFDEWWNKSGAAETLSMEPEYTARVAWLFAEKAEREACAAHVEQYGHMKGLREVCKSLAEGIRMRSNV